MPSIKPLFTLSRISSDPSGDSLGCKVKNDDVVSSADHTVRISKKQRNILIVRLAVNFTAGVLG